MTQLPDVARVRITVLGEELDYRSRQVFLSRDVLLAPKEDVVSTVAVSLYFPDGDGVLTEEKRTLNLYEGDTQGEMVSLIWFSSCSVREIPLRDSERVFSYCS